MSEDVVRTKRLELVDDEGEVRAVMGAESGDNVGLSLFGSNGADRLSLGIHPDGSATLALQDEEGRERIKFSASSSGPVINIKDEEGNPRAQLQVQSNGDSHLMLVDQNQKPRLTIGQIGSKSGAPFITFDDEEGTGRVQLQLGPENTAALGFQDESSTFKVVLGLNSEGSSILLYEDEEGNRQNAF